MVRSADLSDFFVDFRRYNGCFCFTSNENCHFSSEKKKRDTTKRIDDFHLERDTFRNTIMEIAEDFDEKSYNNNGKPWKVVEDFACESQILHFFFFFFFSSFFFIFPFSPFFHFFIFFIFFIFSFFHVFSFFPFFHVFFHFFIFFTF